MHDAARVRVCQRLEHVPPDRDGLSNRRGARSRQHGAERLAGHERHGVVEQGPEGIARQQRDDVRMLQLRRHGNLPLKAIGARAPRQLGREHLDHDSSPEPHLLGEEDAAHSAPELLVDAVLPREPSLQLGTDRLATGLVYRSEDGAECRRNDARGQLVERWARRLVCLEERQRFVDEREVWSALAGEVLAALVRRQSKSTLEHGHQSLDAGLGHAFLEEISLRAARCRVAATRARTSSRA